MKKILFILLLLPFFAESQTYQSMPQAGYGPVKRMLFDSVLTIPLSITSLRNISGGRDIGQLRYNVADSSPYIYSGYQWIKIGGGTGSSQWTDVTGGINYSGGNVGIGTSTPGYKLDINGTINATDLNVLNNIDAGNLLSTGGRLHADGNFDTEDSVKFTNLTSKILDTTNYKPLVIGSTGNVHKTNWFSSGGGSSWSLTGNAGTTSANFIGTTDAQPLVFKVNNTEVGRFDTTTYSIKFGNGTSTANYSVSLGNSNASGVSSTAMGFSTASGASSISGGTSTASGDYSTASGVGSVASGEGSVALGYGSNASASYSVALGGGVASGLSSTAFAAGVAAGQGATAIGQGIAGGVNSTATGSGTASGSYSTSIGYFTTASANFSTAMGRSTTANGNSSTSMGRGTIANELYELTIGRHNDTSTNLNDTIRLFEIGNGSEDGTVRSNILTATVSGIGIGTTTPTHLLHISAADSNVLRLQGLIEGLSTDSMLTIDSDGRVHKRVISGGGSSITTFQVISDVDTTLTNVQASYLFKDISTARTITLPASPTDGLEIQITSYWTNASDKVLTIIQNAGQDIEGVTGGYIIEPKGTIKLKWYDTVSGWQIIEEKL